MEELSAADLKLLFKEEIFLIEEPNSHKGSTELVEPEVITLVVEEPKPQLEKPKVEVDVLAFKGGNAKGIAIIISNDADEFLNTTDETLLLNILKAIGLSLEDVAIINQHNAGSDLQNQLDFTKAIVFGILPSTFGLTIDNYVIQPHNEANWLFSDSLFALANDKVLKGKLWVEIQKLFV